MYFCRFGLLVVCCGHVCCARVEVFCGWAFFGCLFLVLWVVFLFVLFLNPEFSLKLMRKFVGVCLRTEEK